MRINKSQIKQAIIIFIVNILIFIDRPGFAQEQESEDNLAINHANRADYQKGTITLSGDVDIDCYKMRLKADYLQLNMESKDFLAQGSITFSMDNIPEIKGENFHYNLKNKTGTIEPISGYIKPVFFFSKVAELGSNTVTIKNGYFTTCNLSCPHYCLSASTIDFYPGKKIIARNMFFKIRTIPIFYLPYYKKSLGEKRSWFTFVPGQSDFEGKSLRVAYDSYLTKNSSASFQIGYLQKQGIDLVFKHNYSTNNKSKGETYLYRIQKKRDSRWEAEGFHNRPFHGLNALLYLQVMSDANVHRDYPRSERPAATVHELRNYLLLTNVNPYSILRIGIDRQDLWEDNRFRKDDESLPFLNLATILRRFKTHKWYYSSNLSLAHKKISLVQDYYSLADMDINLAKRIKLAKGLTLFPRFGLGFEYCESSAEISGVTYHNILNLRKIYTTINQKQLQFNTEYILQGRFKDNDYYGINKHYLQISGDTWLNNNTNGLMRTGLNLQRKRGEDFKINRQRMLPLTAEFDSTNLKDLTLSARASYSFSDSCLEKFETFGNFKRDKWQMNVCGIFNKDIASKDRTLELNNSIIYQIYPKSQIQFTCYYDLKKGRLKESKVILNQELHCWKAQFSVLQRINPLTTSDNTVEFRVEISLK